MAHGTQFTKNQNTLFQVELSNNERRKSCTYSLFKISNILCIIIILSTCVMFYYVSSNNQFLNEYENHLFASEVNQTGKKYLIFLL